MDSSWILAAWLFAYRPRGNPSDVFTLIYGQFYYFCKIGGCIRGITDAIRMDYNKSDLTIIDKAGGYSWSLINSALYVCMKFLKALYKSENIHRLRIMFDNCQVFIIW